MKQLDPIERTVLINEICEGLAAGATIGQSIRRLRLEVLGIDQESFAKLCKMSSRALYEIESDKGNPRLDTLLGVLRPFGLRLNFGPQGPVRLQTFPAENGRVLHVRDAKTDALTATYELPPAPVKTKIPKRGRNPKLVRAKAAAAAKRKQDSGTAE